MSWKTLTYFGDSMLLIPTAIIMAFMMLWKIDNRQTVRFWIATFCLVGGLVSLSKILFLGFGIGSARYNFTGFSGHSAMSATLWPVLFWLLSARLQPRQRRLAVATGYLIPLMVGLSRLVLSYHSKSEVVTGLLLGFSLSSAFLLSQRQTQVKQFSLPQLSAVLLVPLLLISHGRLATTQQFLERLSASIAGLDKPWSRTDLHKMHHRNR